MRTPPPDETLSAKYDQMSRHRHDGDDDGGCCVYQPRSTVHRPHRNRYYRQQRRPMLRRSLYAWPAAAGDRGSRRFHYTKTHKRMAGVSSCSTKCAGTSLGRTHLSLIRISSFDDRCVSAVLFFRCLPHSVSDSWHDMFAVNCVCVWGGNICSVGFGLGFLSGRVREGLNRARA